jgi:hypothetical protein
VLVGRLIGGRHRFFECVCVCVCVCLSVTETHRQTGVLNLPISSHCLLEEERTLGLSLSSVLGTPEVFTGLMGPEYKGPRSPGKVGL